MKIILCSLMLVLFSSCGKDGNFFEEYKKITPEVSPIKVTDQLKVDRPLKVAFGPIKIDEPFRIFSRIPLLPFIGAIVDGIANTFVGALASLNLFGNVGSDGNKVFIEVPGIDNDVLKSITVTGMTIRMKPRKKRWYEKNPLNAIPSSLKFLNKVKIFIATEESLKKDQKFLIAWYSDKKHDKKNCPKYQCITFRMKANENLLKYLREPTNLYIIPVVDVDYSPRRITLFGETQFKVDFDPGF